ncbi:MAG TPA: sugar phosphate isomerase/epimerase family protein [Methanomassiliicoccales archaeon]|jgi:sugar phosphate isomerase/epimerase
MISLSSPAFSLIPFDQAIEAVAKEFQAWEIVAEGMHRLENIEKRFIEVSGSYDLEYSVHAPLSDINIGSLNPSMRDASLKEVLMAIGSCRKMNIDLITFHPGFITPLGQLDRAAVMRETVRSIHEIDKAAAEHGVVAALENMPRMPISTCTEPTELLSVLEGTSIGVCFDIGHAHTACNIDEFLRHVPRFANVHIHDNDGTSDQHLTIGEGRIDFERVLALMGSYRGRYVIEARRIEGAPLSAMRLSKLLGARSGGRT